MSYSIDLHKPVWKAKDLSGNFTLVGIACDSRKAVRIAMEIADVGL